jgi:radical SAM superfamily enzyme YgiQ (UPF0313 family)
MPNATIALIFPKLVDSIDRFDDGYWLTDKVKGMLRLGRTNFTPPLSLLTIAAVTPSEFGVTIIDERLEDIDFEAKVSLVGISVVTRAARHAYRIADEFRRRGVKVVLGGIHPSVMCEEALAHADAVVKYQGERIWPKLLSDFLSGNLRTVYEGDSNTPIDDIPTPRRDLLKSPGSYLTTKVITASRGCPNSCTFCTSGAAIGKTYRTRSVSGIIRELESIDGRYVIFLDDNLGVDTSYAKELFAALIPLRIHWAGAISVDALTDGNLVRLAAKSGCISLGVGFESLSRQTLKMMGKLRTNDPDHYRDAIARLHDSGIPVLGYFLLGYDPDTLDTFSAIGDFIEETAIEMPSINTLIPYPGTPIHTYLARQGRILHKNWDLYDTAGGFVVYQPKNMSAAQLFEGYLSLAERVYSWTSILGRLRRAGYFDPISAAWSVHYNRQQNRSIAVERNAHEDHQ